jgi:hypothetical protein
MCTYTHGVGTRLSSKREPAAALSGTCTNMAPIPGTRLCQSHTCENVYMLVCMYACQEHGSAKVMHVRYACIGVYMYACLHILTWHTYQERGSATVTHVRMYTCLYVCKNHTHTHTESGIELC